MHDACENTSCTVDGCARTRHCHWAAPAASIRPRRRCWSDPSAEFFASYAGAQGRVLHWRSLHWLSGARGSCVGCAAATLLAWAAEISARARAGAGRRGGLRRRVKRAAMGQNAPQQSKPKKKEAGIVSKTLGYCIIVGAAGAKAPQILQILRAGNAAGLSLLMPVMEVLGCVFLCIHLCSSVQPVPPIKR